MTQLLQNKGGPSKLFEASWCHIGHAVSDVFCISQCPLLAWFKWSVETLHKTKNFVPFDPKWQKKLEGGGGGGGAQFQGTENVTKMQSTTLKTFSLKVIFIHFSDINQHLRSQCTKLCILWSISTNHLNPANGALRNTVNAWDHMSHITSQYLEQFEWCTCAAEE